MPGLGLYHQLQTAQKVKQPSRTEVGTSIGLQQFINFLLSEGIYILHGQGGGLHTAAWRALPTLHAPVTLYYHSAMPGDVAQSFLIIPPERNCPCRKIRKIICWRDSTIELSLLLNQYSLIQNYQKRCNSNMNSYL